ncbi:phosphate ABC transporter permease subunit PstC [Motilibacter aurantiacus]|uniref:phosphate ABC transporter permease subunit PstC n=1 Tax=Motilibacter aurantiacus TaxID=2714955 RepID=UPI002F2B8990
MSAVITDPAAPLGGPDGDVPRAFGKKLSGADRAFKRVTTGSGLAVLVIMGLVGFFLATRAGDALGEAGWSFFTTEAWDPDSGNFGVVAILVGTILIAAVAILVAVPLAVGTALYISEYAPRRIQRMLINLVDLMAAVPSVVYGLWGLYLLQPELLVHGPKGEGLPRWLATYFGWVPFLTVDGVDMRDPLGNNSVFQSSTFIAGLVVAMMVSPVICSIMREVFAQAPIGEREGAYALGATKWGMIRSVVLPFARGGMIGGTMLGLGRAFGETIAVFMVISPLFEVQPHILQSGASSISSLIALRYGESSTFALSALFAAGLTLFALTLVVNSLAAVIVSRSRSGAVSE